VAILDAEGIASTRIMAGHPFVFEFDYDVNEDLVGGYVGFVCTDINRNTLFVTSDTEHEPQLLSHREKGSYRVRFHVPASANLHLNGGIYSIRVYLEMSQHTFDSQEFEFKIIAPDITADFAKTKPHAPISLITSTRTEKLS
jgi:hypothetical protein